MNFEFFSKKIRIKKSVSLFDTNDKHICTIKRKTVCD